MNALRASALLLVCCALVPVARAGESATADWPLMAPISVSDASAGLVEIPLGEAVLDAAKTDLSDLRIFDSTGVETGYVLRLPPERVPDVPVDGRIISRIHGHPLRESITLDFGGPVLKNRVELWTSGKSFRRAVAIEASDDGYAWRTIVENANLVRRPAESTGDAYDRRTVRFPDNDNRYLRLTVTAPGDDTESFQIEDIKCRMSVGGSPENVPVEVLAADVTSDGEKRVTEILIDLGFRNLPLCELSLDCPERNFFRRLAVYARNSEKQVLKTAREDAPPAERVVDAPWALIANTAVYRYSAGDTLDESLEITLRPARCRWLRVVIADGDDPPLEITRTRVTRLIYYAAFQPKAGATCALYFGNPKARRASYELSRFAERLRAEEGVKPATLGPVAANPVKRLPKLPPWSERNKWATWAVLVVALAILAALVARQLKAAKEPPQPDPGACYRCSVQRRSPPPLGQGQG